jgi:hypothetical protein
MPGCFVDEKRSFIILTDAGGDDEDDALVFRLQIFQLILGHLQQTSSNHRDKTKKVHMPQKMFPRLKLLCWLFMGPTLGFDT